MCVCVCALCACARVCMCACASASACVDGCVRVQVQLSHCKFSMKLTSNKSEAPVRVTYPQYLNVFDHETAFRCSARVQV